MQQSARVHLSVYESFSVIASELKALQRHKCFNVNLAAGKFYFFKCAKYFKALFFPLPFKNLHREIVDCLKVGLGFIYLKKRGIFSSSSYSC